MFSSDCCQFPPQDDYTAVMYAAGYNNYDLLDLLVDARANVNAQALVRNLLNFSSGLTVRSAIVSGNLQDILFAVWLINLYALLGVFSCFFEFILVLYFAFCPSVIIGNSRSKLKLHHCFILSFSVPLSPDPLHFEIFLIFNSVPVPDSKHPPILH